MRWSDSSAAGYRRGGARQVVIELLDEQPCALSALDIEDALRAREGRRVGRASIYRALDELVTLDLLSRVEVGDGVARYEPQRPHHDASTIITSSATAAASSSRSRTTRWRRPSTASRRGSRSTSQTTTSRCTAAAKRCRSSPSRSFRDLHGLCVAPGNA